MVAVDHNHLPVINVGNDFPGMLLSMLEFQIFVNPGDEVVFEHAFNQLMKKIRGDKFMDVSTGEVQGERLLEPSELHWKEKNEHTHTP